jgi:asparaginyl-tRNA synthetase
MEKYLTDKLYKAPVCIYNFPKDFKSFYMRLNEDGKTVAAFDILVPGVIKMISHIFILF